MFVGICQILMSPPPVLHTLFLKSLIINDCVCMVVRVRLFVHVNLNICFCICLCFIVSLSLCFFVCLYGVCPCLLVYEIVCVCPLDSNSITLGHLSLCVYVSVLIPLFLVFFTNYCIEKLVAESVQAKMVFQKYSTLIITGKFIDDTFYILAYIWHVNFRLLFFNLFPRSFQPLFHLTYVNIFFQQDQFLEIYDT